MKVGRVAVLFWSASLLAGDAAAHSPIEGLGNFYNGLLHPVFVPAHLLLLIAFGLFVGQQGGNRMVPALAGFALATLVGLSAAWFGIGMGAGVEGVIVSLSAVIGLLIALRPEPGRLMAMAVGVPVGFFLGFDSAQDSLAGQAKLATLFGSGVAIYFLSLYQMVLAERFNREGWREIGVRVVGSWLAASSLLVLALSFSQRL